MSVPSLVSSILVILFIRSIHGKPAEKTSILPSAPCQIDNPKTSPYGYSRLYHQLCTCIDESIDDEARKALDVFCQRGDYVIEPLHLGHYITYRDLRAVSRQSVPLYPVDIGENALPFSECEGVVVKCLCQGQEVTYSVIPNVRSSSEQSESICFFDHKKTCLVRNCTQFEGKEYLSKETSSELNGQLNSMEKEYSALPSSKCQEVAVKCLCQGVQETYNITPKQNTSDHSDAICDLDEGQMCLDRNCTRFEEEENRSKETSPELSGQTDHVETEYSVLSSSKCEKVAVKCLCQGEEVTFLHAFSVVPEKRNTLEHSESICDIDHEQTCLSRNCTHFEEEEKTSKETSPEFKGQAIRVDTEYSVLKSSKCKEVAVKCLCQGEEVNYTLVPEKNNSSEHSESICEIDHVQTCLDRNCTHFEEQENRSKVTFLETSTELNGQAYHVKTEYSVLPSSKCEEVAVKCLCQGEEVTYSMVPEKRNSSEHPVSICDLDHEQTCLDRNCTRFEEEENRSKEMSPWNEKQTHMSHRERRHAHRHKCTKRRGNKNMRCYENEKEIYCFTHCHATREATYRYYDQKQFDVYKCKFRENKWKRSVIACDAVDLCSPTGNHFCHEISKKSNKRICFGMCLSKKKKHTYPYLHRYDCKNDWYYIPKSEYCHV